MKATSQSHFKLYLQRSELSITAMFTSDDCAIVPGSWPSRTLPPNRDNVKLCALIDRRGSRNEELKSAVNSCLYIGEIIVDDRLKASFVKFLRYYADTLLEYLQHDCKTIWLLIALDVAEQLHIRNLHIARSEKQIRRTLRKLDKLALDADESGLPQLGVEFRDQTFNVIANDLSQLEELAQHPSGADQVVCLKCSNHERCFQDLRSHGSKSVRCVLLSIIK